MGVRYRYFYRAVFDHGTIREQVYVNEDDPIIGASEAANYVGLLLGGLLANATKVYVERERIATDTVRRLK
jgi:hypothetical protein